MIRDSSDSWTASTSLKMPSLLKGLGRQVEGIGMKRTSCIVVDCGGYKEVAFFFLAQLCRGLLWAEDFLCHVRLMADVCVSPLCVSCSD